MEDDNKLDEMLKKQEQGWTTSRQRRVDGLLNAQIASTTEREREVEVNIVQGALTSAGWIDDVLFDVRMCFGNASVEKADMVYLEMVKIRRLEPQSRWDKEAVANVIGVPWRM